MSSLRKHSPLIDSNKMSMYNNLKEIFTEDEWNAIYDAMADYQDHGENETELAYSVQSKITELFNWTGVTVLEPSTIGWFPRQILYCSYMNNETPSNNPYVNNLVEMGYDRQDCEMVAAAGLDASYPRTIHGRTFETKADYDEALADYLNGLWQSD